MRQGYVKLRLFNSPIGVRGHYRIQQLEPGGFGLGLSSQTVLSLEFSLPSSSPSWRRLEKRAVHFPLERRSAHHERTAMQATALTLPLHPRSKS